MAIIHRTTMEPTKLELLTSWLPGRSWYLGDRVAPLLTKSGGFRLDDPDGRVGLEFMAVTDDSGDEPVTYHVPLSYRGAPLTGVPLTGAPLTGAPLTGASLTGANDALIGTSQHGVLGQRWIYDGTRDPVLVGQLFALLLGEAEPQAQSISDTIDPSVSIRITGHVGEPPAEVVALADGPRSTDITLRPSAAPGPVMIRVNRVLRPNRPGLMSGTLGHVTAEWSVAGVFASRGRFVVLRVP